MGCAGSLSVPPLAEDPLEVSAVPFHPQTTDQCGPAALTSVLQFSGAEVSFDQVRERVYVPDRQGSLQLELLAASRSEDRLPVRVPTTSADLVTLLKSGRPVLVMQNLGVALIPLWHFAVVIGYLPDSDQFILRSGADRRRLMSRRAFEASWERAERWGIVLFSVAEAIQGVDLLDYLDEATAMESLGKRALAQQAYRRAIERWPDAALARLGLGNSYYGEGRLKEARIAYTQALQQDPDNLVARNNLAHVLGESGCPVRALALLDEVSELNTSAIPDQQLASTRQEVETVLAEKGDHCDLAADGLMLFSAAPDRVLQGVLQRADHQTYRELAFELPAGVEQLRVVFSYDRSTGTVIDLGLRDPDRFRGWSGGNKQTFTVGEFQATPSYLAGPLPQGTWHLLLGIPNIRDDVSTDYRAEIYFEASALDAAAGAGTGVAAPATVSSAGPSVTVSNAPGWYRGDFHAHSGHSDGTCAAPPGARSGARVACPVTHTIDAAVARGLDFVALTEHNTWSHLQDLVDFQTAYPRMLLLSGMELTTFAGHANLFGGTWTFDFPAAAWNLSDTIVSVRTSGGLVSINHPGLPSDERCLGCGWTANIDPGLVDAVEIANGGVLRASGDGGDSTRGGIRFWESLLNAGYRVTGVGGSDNHDALLPASEPSAIGRPTTVVFAQSLSAHGLLDGVRSGRVFIDVEGSRERLIDITAVSTGSMEGPVSMGESLCVRKGQAVDLTVRVKTAADDRLVVILNGTEALPYHEVDASGSARIQHRLHSPGREGWVRVESRSASGTTRLFSNPIYFDCQL